MYHQLKGGENTNCQLSIYDSLVCCICFNTVWKGIKLDEKNVKCVMFGVSKESEAHIYDPEQKKNYNQ